MRFAGINWRTFALALVASALASASSFAANIDIGVRAAVASNQPARVIMQFATRAERDAAFTRLLDRGASVRAVDTDAGAALVVFGSPAVLNAEFSRATSVSLDADVRVQSDLRVVDRAAWHAPAYSSTATQLLTPRGGISVAIIDSGISPHPDLPLSRIRYFRDFVGGSRTPVDGCGHGTHVAGIVAGNGARSDGLYAGIAPDVDIVALRVLGDDCSGNTSDVIDALEWIARYHAAYQIKVVNISLGHAVLEPLATDPLVQAVERLSRKGIVIVTAAGNKGINPATGNPGYGGVGVPCNAPSAICVGSLATGADYDLDNDEVAYSSARGPTRFDLLAKPDLVAPGVNMVSIAAHGSRLFNDYPLQRVAGSTGHQEYFTLSGTSMASPVVAGAAALLLRGNDRLTANAVKIALQFTARVLPQADVLTQGAGVINIAGAQMLAEAIDPAAPAGANWIRRALTAANTDAIGREIVWGRRIIYGDRFVHPRFAELHVSRWNDDIGWGDTTGDDSIFSTHETDNAVWGIDRHMLFGREDGAWQNTVDDNIVWGSGYLRHVWASNVVAGFWDENNVWGSITRDTEHEIAWGTRDRGVARNRQPMRWEH